MARQSRGLFALHIRDQEEVDYLRLLDSLARTYNSQITAHVGYELTATVGLAAALVGATSVAVGSNKDLLPVMVVIDLTILGVFFIAPFPFCSKHLYGRLQYYGELSQATSEHMGLKTPYLADPGGDVWHASSYVRALRKRRATSQPRGEKLSSPFRCTNTKLLIP